MPDVKTIINAIGTACAELLHPENSGFKELSQLAFSNNPWLSEKNIRLRLEAIANGLTIEKINDWYMRQDIQKNASEKQIVLICSDHMPFGGIHDLLSILACGHQAIVYGDEKAHTLLRYVQNIVQETNSDLAHHIRFSKSNLKQADAFIINSQEVVTQTSLQYFQRFPVLLRNKTASVALLNGDENNSDVKKLAHDISSYFGLSRKNIRKLYLPKGFNLIPLFDEMEKLSEIKKHNRFMNNYDYYRSVFLLNKQKHYDTGNFLWHESSEIIPPYAVVFYEYYNSVQETLNKLQLNPYVEQVFTNEPNENTLAFGDSNAFDLNTYDMGLNTIEFLQSI